MSITDSDSALLMRIASQVAAPSPKVEPTAKPVLDEIPEAVPAEPEKSWSLPGFGAKSRVLTAFGSVPLEALRRRDPVRTFDGRFLEVDYVDEIRFDRRFLINHPEAQPILVPRGALGGGMPETDLFVSEAQKLRVMDRMTAGTGIPAGEMIGRSGIMRKSHGYFTYYTFHCSEPCFVNIDGAWCHIAPTKTQAAA